MLCDRINLAMTHVGDFGVLLLLVFGWFAGVLVCWFAGLLVCWFAPSLGVRLLMQSPVVDG